MSVEISLQPGPMQVLSRIFHIRPKSELAVRTNGVFSLTDRGHLVHRLVLADKALKDCDDPNTLFSMTAEYREQCVKTREDLCRKLKLPEDGREMAIEDLGRQLAHAGFPHYKIVR